MARMLWKRRAGHWRKPATIWQCDFNSRGSINRAAFSSQMLHADLTSQSNNFGTDANRYLVASRRGIFFMLRRPGVKLPTVKHSVFCFMASHSRLGRLLNAATEVLCLIFGYFPGSES
jgi:hypothetical protein